MNVRQASVLIGLALWTALSLAQAKPDANKPMGGSSNAKPAPSQVVSATSDPDYVIGPEDMLNISVWKEPDVSGAVPVRPDGKISMPLLGDMQAAGSTPMQLTQRLTDGLKKYMDDPRVTVIVTAINSRRVFILGQVGRPGAFPLLPHMTVLQAISSAGGLTPYAGQSKIYVLRNDNGKQTKLPFNYKEVLRGQKPEQDIELKAGDTIVVP